jgi:ankyrin repeat protein
MYHRLSFILLLSISLSAMEQPVPMEMTPVDVQKSPFELLPIELKAHISTFLVRGVGDTPAERLQNAAGTLRRYMRLSRSFVGLLSDGPSSGILVHELAQRYTKNNIVDAAIALQTKGATEYLKKAKWKFDLGDQIRTSIDCAAAQGNNWAVKSLLDRHPFINHQATINAAINGHSATLTLLLDHRITIIDHESSKTTPLIAAAMNGHTQLVAELITLGHNPCHIQHNENSYFPHALFCASEHGHAETVKFLLATSASTLLNWQNQHQITALMRAAESGHLEVVKILLAAHAHADIQDHVRLTALMRVTHQSNPAPTAVAIVRELLNAGANVNLRSAENRTALSSARRNPSNVRDKEEMVKLLLKHDAVE